MENRAGRNSAGVAASGGGGNLAKPKQCSAPQQGKESKEQQRAP